METTPIHVGALQLSSNSLLFRKCAFSLRLTQQTGEIHALFPSLFLVMLMLFSATLSVKAATALFDSANFVLIRGGEFTMGSSAGEVNRQVDETQHQVRVSNFAISKYAVTVAEFKRFVEASGYKTDAEKSGDTANWRHGVSGSMRLQSEENHPVLHVSWNDAVAYCTWLSAKTGKHFRLPTEAEWEYACRAGSRTPFNTKEKLTTNQSNYDSNNNPKGEYRQNTVAVNSFSPNAWGLYNMLGNAWEWCSDWYDGTYYNDCKAQGIVTNPAGAVSGLRRVLRGGSWHNDANNARPSDRSFSSPVKRYSIVSFRVVFDP